MSGRQSAQLMNAKLEQLYRPVWEAAIRGVPGNRRISAPLFIRVSQSYSESRCRLLVVGQQTQQWPPRSEFAELTGTDAFDKLLDQYVAFEFGSDRKGAPFWYAAHQLREAVCPGSDRSAMVWSNVVKLDEDGGTPPRDLEDWIGQFHLLEREIQIIKPDVVAFFTGPTFDGRIKQRFRGIRQAAISKYLSRLAHENLPKRSFRCHHPNWLRRSGNWSTIQELCAHAIDSRS